MTTIDLNCDLGESYGAYTIGNDEALLQVATSANIACGFHAGDPHVMRQTVERALKLNIAIGAHPGFPDLNGFGRRSMALSPEEVYDIILYQVGALQAVVHAEGGHLSHVKPHGALYNMAAKDAALAVAVAGAIAAVDPSLILYGLSGSRLIEAGRAAGLKTASEVFADRTYQQDGGLTPRSHSDALITDERTALRQVLEMVKHGSVRTVQGNKIQICADTLCIHGDGAHALAFAKKIRESFEKEGIAVQPL